MTVTGWRCAACGATRPITAILPWRCPNGDDRHHVLRAIGAEHAPDEVEDPHPFIAYDGGLAWAACAAAYGMDRPTRARLVRRLDAQIAAVTGTGFRVTPCHRAEQLSETLGFDTQGGGGVWVKDETGNVAGSQKARHLFTILLHLVASEELGVAPWGSPAARPPLAISSCGNAAIAASTLAAATKWPIIVFVPPWASEAVLLTLNRLGAEVRVCPRRDDDPPGDPCIHRFREAVSAGAVPFGVQGPENALCLDGGRTLGWELLGASRAAGFRFDRVFVQVGGGAFAACIGDALRSETHPPRLHAVQAEGCAPLAGAWKRAQHLPDGVTHAAQHWTTCMRVWGSDGEPTPASIADGILDDETYDWVAIVEALTATAGSVVIAPEAAIEAAHRLMVDTTGIDATPTGTAGLAGLISIRDQIDDDERVAVIASGVTRR